MKLRIQPGKIVFRLAPEDVDALVADGRIEVMVPTGPTQFQYAIGLVNGPEIDLRFEDQIVELGFPAHLIFEWSTTQKIGFHKDLGDLTVVVEKDLARRHKTSGGR